MTGEGEWAVIEAIDDALHLDGASISTRTWRPDPLDPSPPEIVFLHDGLGSIAQWRDVPAQVAEHTGASVMAYDRPGHGASLPVPEGPWPADWLRSEADRLDRLLQAVGAERPLLVGHSDGGSIALLHAAHHENTCGVVTIAAHAWLEREAVTRITELQTASDLVVDKLARFHDHPEQVFAAWSGVWTSAEFSSWDIRPELAQISVPCHIVQGDADEYGTSLQATDTAAVIGETASCTLVPGGRHLLHHGQPETVISMVKRFWEDRHAVG